MYLLDADSLMHANRHDFPININPGTFWQFLEEMGGKGEIKIPQSIYDEIARGDDSLNKWLSQHKDIFILPTVSVLLYLQQVLDAYGSMTDIELEELNRKADPYLIAHALATGATIVTNEISSPHATGPLNKHIPDICGYLKISCLRYPRFLWEMSPRANNDQIKYHK
jgi:hypothetical protein